LRMSAWARKVVDDAHSFQEPPQGSKDRGRCREKP
jgi:hypothetical protein